MKGRGFRRGPLRLLFAAGYLTAMLPGYGLSQDLPEDQQQDVARPRVVAGQTAIVPADEGESRPPMVVQENGFQSIPAPLPPADLFPASPTEQTFTSEPMERLDEGPEAPALDDASLPAENEATPPGVAGEQDLNALPPASPSSSAGFSGFPTLRPVVSESRLQPEVRPIADHPSQPAVPVRSSTVNSSALNAAGDSVLQEQAGPWAANAPADLDPPTGMMPAGSAPGNRLPPAPVDSDPVTRPADLSLDAQVQPASYSSASPAAPASGNVQLARQVFEKYDLSRSSSLPGTPLRLVEAMIEPLPPVQRSAMVRQYWDTYYDWAAVVLARQFQQWTQSLPSGAAPGDAELVQLARSLAADRLLAAEIQLGKSQSQLLDYLPSRLSQSELPLPSDTPLISAYRTDYEVYRQWRRLPSSLRGIDAMLPRTLTLIKQRASTAVTAQQATQRLLSGVQSRQANLSSVLFAAEQWRQAELGLVASVVSYNQAIGDYILNVEPNQRPDALVGLMIGAPANSQPDNVMPASGNLPVRQAQLPDANLGQSVLQSAPSRPAPPSQFQTLPPASSPLGNPASRPANAFGSGNSNAFGGSFGAPSGNAGQTAPPASINGFSQ